MVYALMNLGQALHFLPPGPVHKATQTAVIPTSYARGQIRIRSLRWQQPLVLAFNGCELRQTGSAYDMFFL